MSSWSSVLLSQSERDYIVAGCRDDCRVDGRKCFEYRPFTIITGNEHSHHEHQHHDSHSSSIRHVVVLEQPQLVLSSGSARLVSTCGNTHLLCSIKAEVVRPTRQLPCNGVVELHVETLLTTSGGSSGSGGSGMSRRDCDELAVLLSRLLFPTNTNQSSLSSNDGNDNNTRKQQRQSLCILPYVYVWRLHVDLYLLSCSGGSLLDAASHVIRAALDNTLLPAITTTTTTTNNDNNAAPVGTTNTPNATANVELLVDGDIQKAQPPDIDSPMIVSVAVLNCKNPYSKFNSDNDDDDDNDDDGSTTNRIALLLDATAEEESCATAIVHVAVNNTSNNNQETITSKNDWYVTAIQKSLPGSLPINLLPEIMSTALQGAQTLSSCTRDEPTTTAVLSNNKTQQQKQQFSFLQEQFFLQS